MTIQWMVRDGIEMFAYPLPVFGPPWTAPMEFPLYQASAALLVRAGIESVDVAGRMTHLIYFYLSAALLALVTLRVFPDRSISAVAVLLYLYSPFNVFWSRTVMIEFTAVFFALSYVWAMLGLIESRRRLVGWTVLACVAGSMGYLTKLTTMLPFDFMLAPVMLWAIQRDRATDSAMTFRRIGAMCVAVVVPLAVGLLWIRYADAVKAASPYTQHLTSEALKGWNFGSLGQRFSSEFWQRMIVRLIGEMTSIAAWIVLPFAIWAAARASGPARWIVAGSLMAVPATLLVFTNLHWVHNYYQAAFTPMLAITMAVGLVAIVRRLPRAPRSTLALLICVFLLGRTETWYQDVVSPAPSAAWIPEFAAEVARVTPADEWILAHVPHWDPSWPYYTSRRSLLYLADRMPADLVQTLRRGRFHTFVTVHRDDPLLDLWRTRELVHESNNHYVYRVDDLIVDNEESQSPPPFLDLVGR